MGKEKQPKNKVSPKLQHKKSVSATITRSRTISTIAQVSKASNVLGFSNKDGSKTSRTMRDHCMETDFCILRRYCKTKNIKMNRRLLNTKSKYSVNKELAADEQSKTDDSACGDTKQKNGDILGNIEDINVNLTDLVIRNLNKLLRDWIKKYLFDNEETKKKIQTILDSMLRKLEANNNASSCSTYTVDIRITKPSSKTTNAGSNSINLLNYTQKPTQEIVIPKCKTYSSITLPLADKHFSIISTLSIPRYFHACHHQMTGKNLSNSLNKVRRAYNKNILLTISKSNRLLSNSSSLGLVEISANSLTKHFATYRDKNMIRRTEKKRRIVFIPSSYYKFPGSTSATNINEEVMSARQKNMESMPSLVKSIFTDEVSNIESNFLEKVNDNYTMTDERICDGGKLLRENATNVSPRETVNVATENENLSGPSVTQTEIVLQSNNENCESTKEICPCNQENLQSSCRACFKTSEEEIESDPLLLIDFLEQNDPNCSNEDIDEKPSSASCGNKQSLLKKMFSSKRKKKCCFKDENFEKIRYKRFSYLHKKSDNKLKHNDFMEHVQNMFNYFANYKGKRNINLDIRISVYPTLEGDDENENKNNQPCGICNDTKASQTAILCEKSEVIAHHEKSEEKSMIPQEKFKTQMTHFCNCQQKLISTDDDASRKYAKSTETCIEHLEKIEQSAKYLSNQNTTTADLEIAQEVFQLRNIIKELAVTAEKFVQDHLNNTNTKVNVNNEQSTNRTVLFSTNVECIHAMPQESPIKIILGDVKNSKGTQFINNASCQKLSCLKIKKEANKNNTNELQNRLMKKSTSYNVIESETILKVTDMTSAAQTLTSNAVADEALTCSLPKCKSLYEISVESNNNKLVAFYCDEFLRNQETNNNTSCPHSPLKIPESCPLKSQSCLSNTTRTNKENPSKCNDEIHCTKCLSEITRDCGTNDLSSSVLITIDGKPTEKKIAIRNRRVIGFREGSLYCLLLWIPVFIILWLLYIYIIRDKLKPKIYTSDKFSKLLSFENNGSSLNISLSELGF